MEENIKYLKVVDHAFEKPIVDAVMKRISFSYGWKSTKIHGAAQGHWNHNVTQGLLFSNQERDKALSAVDLSETLDDIYQPFWKIAVDLFGPRRLCRAYINAYTYGTDAYLHPDTDYNTYPPNHECRMQTIIFYLNDEWNPDFAGETVFVEDGDIFKSVLPKPGRVICFDSEILHGARPLSRACFVLRGVLVFKTVVDQYSESDAIDYLFNLTNNIPHSGSTLFDHLSGTYGLMKTSGFNRYVCLAGLFHSVYDTEYFTADFPITREEVINVIGKKAENLVHLFCTLRPRKRFILSSDLPEQVDLAAIEYANILEQSQRVQVDVDYVKQLKNIIKR